MSLIHLDAQRRITGGEWLLCLAASLVAFAGLAVAPHWPPIGERPTVTRQLPMSGAAVLRYRPAGSTLEAGSWQTQQDLWPSRSRI